MVLLTGQQMALEFLLVAAILNWSSSGVWGCSTMTAACEVTPPTVTCKHVDYCGSYHLSEALRNATKAKMGLQLRLESSVLSDLPKNIFDGVPIVHLDIRRSILPTFPHPSFQSLNGGLKKLDLSLNNVGDLDVGALKTLPFRASLTYLSFYQNAIRELPAFAFVDFPNLEYLDLSRNLLHKLPDQVFGGLTKLQELQLTGNAIEQVGVNAFPRMDTLSILNLGDNWISTLVNGTFDDVKMPKIVNLWLPYNIFDCNCNLSWLKIWLSQHNILDDSRATCETPTFATFKEVNFCGGGLQQTANSQHQISLQELKEHQLAVESTF